MKGISQIMIRTIQATFLPNINKKPHFRETTDNHASDAESDVTLVDHIQFNIHS
jgi:hypothetical protein